MSRDKQHLPTTDVVKLLLQSILVVGDVAGWIGVAVRMEPWRDGRATQISKALIVAMTVLSTEFAIRLPIFRDGRSRN